MCMFVYIVLFVGLSYYIYITILFTSKLHCIVYCVNVCCIVLFDSLHCYYFGKSRANDEPFFWHPISGEQMEKMVFNKSRVIEVISFLRYSQETWT